MTTATAETTIRAAIKTAIETVTDAGTCHDYLRWAVDYTTFLNFFKTTVSNKAVIRGSTITCERMPQSTDDGDGASYGERNTGNVQSFGYRVRYYHGLDDSAASEKTALGKVLAMVDALDVATTTVDTSAYLWGPASLEIFEPRQFGNVLCHYGEIAVTVKRFT